MTRPLALPAAQVTALCKGAAKAGYAPIVQIGKVFVRLVPEKHAIHPQENDGVDTPESLDSLDDYFGWRDRKRAREDQGHS